jgi:hypothetical protein
VYVNQKRQTTFVSRRSKAKEVLLDEVTGKPVGK